MSMVEIACEIKQKTFHEDKSTKAILVDSGLEEDWVPWSMVDDYCEEGGEITSIFIPQWLAEDKGFL